MRKFWEPFRRENRAEGNLAQGFECLGKFLQIVQTGFVLSKHLG